MLSKYQKNYMTDGFQLPYLAYVCAFVCTFGLIALPTAFLPKNTTPLLIV